MLAIVTVALLIAAFVMLLGFQIKEQFANLIKELPQYITNIVEWLGIDDLEQQLTEKMKAASIDSGLLGPATG